MTWKVTPVFSDGSKAETRTFRTLAEAVEEVERVSMETWVETGTFLDTSEFIYEEVKGE
jgi:hypothetical protein